MTLFDPKSLQELGADSSGNTVVLGTLYCDTIADLPAPNAFQGYVLSMGFRAVVINDNSVHRLNSQGQWIQILAGNSSYTREEIDAIINDINTDMLSAQTQINYLVNAGAKNIVQNTADDSRVIAGVTWTKNDDDSMTANGTSTGVSAVRVVGVQGSSSYANAVPIPAGTYIISASGFDVTRLRFALGYFADENTARTVISVYDEPQTLTVEGNTARYDLSCVVAVSGETLNGETWFPMIRPSIIADSSYTPYAPTNRELYEMIRGFHP